MYNSPAKLINAINIKDGNPPDVLGMEILREIIDGNCRDARMSLRERRDVREYLGMSHESKRYRAAIKGRLDTLLSDFVVTVVIQCPCCDSKRISDNLPAISVCDLPDYYDIESVNEIIEKLVSVDAVEIHGIVANDNPKFAIMRDGVDYNFEALALLETGILCPSCKDKVLDSYNSNLSLYKKLLLEKTLRGEMQTRKIHRGELEFPILTAVNDLLNECLDGNEQIVCPSMGAVLKLKKLLASHELSAGVGHPLGGL